MIEITIVLRFNGKELCAWPTKVEPGDIVKIELRGHGDEDWIEMANMPEAEKIAE